MNILLVADSFKESFASIKASEIIKKGIVQVIPTSTVTLKTMADGERSTTIQTHIHEE